LTKEGLKDNSYRNSQHMSCDWSYIRHCNQNYQKRKVNCQTNPHLTFDNKEPVIMLKVVI
jgi:hypothetical protein